MDYDILYSRPLYFTYLSEYRMHLDGMVGCHAPEGLLLWLLRTPRTVWYYNCRMIIRVSAPLCEMYCYVSDIARLSPITHHTL